MSFPRQKADISFLLQTGCKTLLGSFNLTTYKQVSRLTDQQSALLLIPCGTMDPTGLSSLITVTGSLRTHT